MCCYVIIIWYLPIVFVYKEWSFSFWVIFFNFFNTRNLLRYYSFTYSFFWYYEFVKNYYIFLLTISEIKFLKGKIFLYDKTIKINLIHMITVKTLKFSTWPAPNNTYTKKLYFFTVSRPESNVIPLISPVRPKLLCFIFLHFSVVFVLFSFFIYIFLFILLCFFPRFVATSAVTTHKKCALLRNSDTKVTFLSCKSRWDKS